MPRATLASRNLKNKDTCLDLFVPTFRETKGLMTNVVHYQVVLVSSLSCFKAPSHKESDVVQYSVEKKISECEELRNKISELFSGTVLPPINKKSMIVNEAVLRERRNSIEIFLKFLASTKKLSTCQPLLEFLGVDTVRAKKFSRGESLDQNQDISQSTRKEDEEDKTPDNDVFKEEEEEIAAEELFSHETHMERTGEESIFEAGGVGVFGGQDLKRELTEEDEADFSFIPDAIISSRVTERTELQEERDKQEEDNHSDLFEFNDDLDQLMNITISKKSKETAGLDLESPDASQSSQGESSEVSAPMPEPAKKPQKPQIPSKPSVPSKPALPSKPKPGTKPSIPKKSDSSDTIKKSSLQSQKVEEKSHMEGYPSDKTGIGHVDDLNQDDILKYLQDQSETTNDDDLDLFS